MNAARGRIRTKLVAATLTGAVLVGAGVAVSPIADAQTDEQPERQAERMQHRQERLQDLVDEGVITQERADEILARMTERAERQAERRAEQQANLEELAAFLDTTPDDLKAELRAGTSLAELAEAAGVDVETLIDEIEARITARVEEAVADGRIDQEKADERLADLRERITARVNGERAERPDGFAGRERPGRGGPGHGPFGGRGFGPFADGG